MPRDQKTVGQYYDWLARYQTLVRWLGHRGGFDSLTVHRLLRSDRLEIAPADVVHERLLRALGPMVSPCAIDAGCGVGGTIFFLHARLGGRYDGLTLSPVQRARAQREADERGIGAACRFHVRSYDDPLQDLAPEGADLIVAIESLAHARNPAASIAAFAQVLRPGGRLAIVDDVPSDSLDERDADLEGFRDGWSCPALARASTLAAAVEAAGLIVAHEEDLTPLVPLRGERGLAWLIAANRRWRRLFGPTPIGRLVDSLHGGLMLERLYRRGLMRYRFLLLRPGAPAPHEPAILSRRDD